MYQGTTPALVFMIPKYDLRDKTVYLTFQITNQCQMTKTGKDLLVVYDDANDATAVVCRLTQEETLSIAAGTNVMCQIRFIGENGLAYATVIRPVSTDPVLMKQIIGYKGGSGE